MTNLPALSQSQWSIFFSFRKVINQTNILLTSDKSPIEEKNEHSAAATGGQEEDKQEDDCKYLY